MKNWEFYEKELRKYKFAFAMRDNQICCCLDVACDKCAFDPDITKSCSEAKMKWLYQEHKEPVVLTDDEKSLCKLLGRGWIARDKNGKLYWFEIINIDSVFPQCKFDFIKWEDEEPWEVKIDD